MSEIKAGSVIENVTQTRMLAETALSSETSHQTGAAAKGPPPPIIEEDRNTNNTSNSQVRLVTLYSLPTLHVMLFNCISSHVGHTQKEINLAAI